MCVCVCRGSEIGMYYIRHDDHFKVHSCGHMGSLLSYRATGVHFEIYAAVVIITACKCAFIVWKIATSTFFKRSPFVFNRRKIIQVRNDMRVLK